MAHRILVVDDDKELRLTISEALLQSDFEVHQGCDGLEALTKIKELRFDFVMLDVNMPHLNGMECLTKIKEYDPSIIVIVMTAYSNIEDAVKAIKEGAFNYLAKPIKHQAIVEMVQKALEAKQMIHHMALSAPVVTLDAGEFVGHSNEMKKIFNVIHKLTKVDTSVLIRGESGTGKELVARAIHFNSSRKDKRFVAINCSSIPETLFESELFGHEKGAFTGATQRQIGKFQYAEGGTLFLDEIGDLPLNMQVKLLRVIQEHRFSPVGCHREIEMDTRIVAATNRNLEEMIQNSTFREDLFYRLNVIPIYLPPLRERKDDIERLICHFIQKFSALHRRVITNVSPKVTQIILRHHWPGNIRELENVIEHAFVIENSETINSSALPQYLLPLESGAEPKDLSPVNLEAFSNQEALSNQEEAEEGFIHDPGTFVMDLDYHLHKEKFEREFIITALKKFKGRINQTALHAKIPKKTLLRKLQKYSINPEDYKIY